MQAHITLGRLCGVQIGLHDTWLLIAMLLLFALAGHWQAVHATWGQGIIWVSAMGTVLLFFATCCPPCDIRVSLTHSVRPVAIAPASSRRASAGTGLRARALPAPSA